MARGVFLFIQLYCLVAAATVEDFGNSIQNAYADQAESYEKVITAMKSNSERSVETSKTLQELAAADPQSGMSIQLISVNAE
jgi:hypothetical protein